MGFVGLVKENFYQGPEWSDQDKPAGHTSQAPQIGKPGWWYDYLTLKNFFDGPSPTWLVITTLVYVLVPYDLEAAGKGWALSWILPRVVVNVVLCMSYCGWWLFSLDGLGWGKRPFKPNRACSLQQVLHNMWFTFLGCLNWTAWEVAFLYMFGTGRLPYASDTEVLSGGWSTFSTIFWILAAPIWGEAHFYFSHRLTHFKPIYKYVHYIHHRNTDVEPFSGLAMHPIEHMYYLSTAGIAVFLRTSPFIMLWMGLRTMLFPAASHSGFEDHYASDQHHYIHHRYFECNYGGTGLPLDQIFGTFRDKMGAQSVYKGASEADTSEKTLDLTNAKARLGVPESWDHWAYWAGTVIIFAALYNAAAELTGDSSETAVAQHVALLVSVGPIILGILLLAASGDAKRSGIRKMLLYPFHREFLLGSLGINGFCGVLFTLVPIYVTVATLLLPPGLGLVSSFYH